MANRGELEPGQGGKNARESGGKHGAVAGEEVRFERNLMTDPDFDLPGPVEALAAKREDDGLSWRQVASAARVSASTLTRLQQGRVARSAELLAALPMAPHAAVGVSDFRRGRGR
jgi:hypothetical protein